MSSGNHPHVIYVLSDQHRGQALSHRGDPNVRTAVLDGMAEAGVSFTHAYANCPVCTPSRGTIFSGRHAHAGPVQGFWDVYKATAPSIATTLGAAGYHSAYFGKWHCGMVQDQIPPSEQGLVGCRRHFTRVPEYHRAGFDDWFGCDAGEKHFDTGYFDNDADEVTPFRGYLTDNYFDLAIDYLKRYSLDKPLFMTLSIHPPHFPLEVPEQWLRFDPQTLQLRENCAAVGPYEQEIRRQLACYYAMIENLDYNIGRLMEALAALPQFRDTLTVYFSDHGEFLGSHGRSLRKEHPHEEAINIPAVFHWPGHIAPQGCVDEHLFSLVDLMPTTLGLLGLPIPAFCQGKDFSPALRGEPFEGPREVLLEMVGNPRWNMDFLDWRGLVDRSWKYAFYETGAEVLFDRQKDPYELTNLAERMPKQCAQLRERLLELLHESREPYFDVLITEGVAARASRDIGSQRGSFNHCNHAVPCLPYSVVSFSSGFHCGIR